MRIHDLHSASVRAAEAGKPSEKPLEAERPSPGEGHGDKVALSPLSAALSNAGEDAARTEQLRLDVEASSYQAPPAQVSQSIVEFHLEPEEPDRKE